MWIERDWRNYDDELLDLYFNDVANVYNELYVTVGSDLRHLNEQSVAERHKEFLEISHLIDRVFGEWNKREHNSDRERKTQ